MEKIGIWQGKHFSLRVICVILFEKEKLFMAHSGRLHREGVQSLPPVEGMAAQDGNPRFVYQPISHCGFAWRLLQPTLHCCFRHHKKETMRHLNIQQSYLPKANCNNNKLQREVTPPRSFYFKYGSLSLKRLYHGDLLSVETGSRAPQVLSEHCATALPPSPTVGRS